MTGPERALLAKHQCQRWGRWSHPGGTSLGLGIETQRWQVDSDSSSFGCNYRHCPRGTVLSRDTSAPLHSTTRPGRKPPRSIGCVCLACVPGTQKVWGIKNHNPEILSFTFLTIRRKNWRIQKCQNGNTEIRSWSVDTRFQEHMGPSQPDHLITQDTKKHQAP